MRSLRQFLEGVHGRELRVGAWDGQLVFMRARSCPVPPTGQASIQLMHSCAVPMLTTPILCTLSVGGHVVDDNDRRLINTYLDALIRQDLMPSNVADATAAPAAAAGEAAAESPESAAAVPEPAAGPQVQLEQPELELAPGFRPPPPSDYESMRAFIENFPPDAPPLYAMHGNAQLSLLNSQTEALFQAVLEVGGAAFAGSSAAGAAGGAPGAGSGASAPAGGTEAAVRASLADLLGRLPPPLSIVDIEARVKDKTPFVVVALQVGGGMKRALGGRAL